MGEEGREGPATWHRWENGGVKPAASLPWGDGGREAGGAGRGPLPFNL